MQRFNITHNGEVIGVHHDQGEANVAMRFLRYAMQRRNPGAMIALALEVAND